MIAKLAILFPLVLGTALPLSADDDPFEPTVVIPRPFPPIVTPPAVTAGEADGQWVEPEELVLGVVRGRHARAYPVNALKGPRREIINDELGGEAIAATW